MNKNIVPVIRLRRFNNRSHAATGAQRRVYNIALARSEIGDYVVTVALKCRMIQPLVYVVSHTYRVGHLVLAGNGFGSVFLL